MRLYRSLTCIGAAAIALIGYGLTAARTLQVGDAGEQITTAHVLGVGHPPGTPLYMLIGKLWETVIPIGSIAWRYNILNLVLGGLIVGVAAYVFLPAIGKETLSKTRLCLAAFGLSLSLGFSQTLWDESTAASTYVLHSLFVVIWLGLAGQIAKKDNTTLRWLYLLCGFSLANHILSLTLLAGTWTLSCLLLIGKKTSFRRLLGLQFLLAPGLLFYLYVPIRSLQGAVINWGRPDNFERLASYLLREEYQANAWVASYSDLAQVIGYHCLQVFREFSPLFWAAVIISAALLLYHKRSTSSDENSTDIIFFQSALPGIILFILNLLLVSLHGSHSDLFFWHRYFLTGYIGAFWSGACIFRQALGAVSPKAKNALLILLLAAPLLSLKLNFAANDKSENTLLNDYLKSVLSQVPPNATLLAGGDNHLFGLLYLHLIEGLRPDINLAAKSPALGDEKRAALDLQARRYFSAQYAELPPPYSAKPFGLIFFFGKEDDALQTKASWDSFMTSPLPEHLSPLEEVLVATFCYRRARYCLILGETDCAKTWTEKLIPAAKRFPQSLLIAGYSFQQLGDKEKAAEYFHKALDIDPKNVGAIRALRQGLAKP